MKKQEQLSQKIENDLSKAKESYYEKDSNNDSNFLSLRKKTDDLRRKKKKSNFMCFLLFVALFAAFLIINSTVLGIVIVNEVITYLLIAIVLMLFVCILRNMIKKSYKKRMLDLMSTSEYEEYSEISETLFKDYEKEVKYISELKYRSEQEKLERTKKDNDIEYEEIRKKIFDLEYGNAVFIYCKKVGNNAQCSVEVDDIEQIVIDRKNELKYFCINDGYHSIKVENTYYVKYSDGTVSHRACYFRFQISNEKCPFFIVVDKVSGYQSSDTCRTVSFDEFEKEIGKSLIE